MNLCICVDIRRTNPHFQAEWKYATLPGRRACDRRSTNAFAEAIVEGCEMLRLERSIVEALPNPEIIMASSRGTERELSKRQRNF